MGEVACRDPSRDLPADPGVVDDERGVHAHGRAVGQRRDPGQQPRRERRPADPGGVGLVDGLVDDGPDLVVGERERPPAAGTQTRMPPPSPMSRAWPTWYAAMAMSGTLWCARTPDERA